MPTDFISLFSLLVQQQCRFVIVGGLAVLLHGHDRLTADVDLVIDLSVDEARKTISALLAAGYRPLAPVDALEFASQQRREEWQRVKGMQVFSLWDSTNTRPSVDLFVVPPIPFEDLYAAATIVSIAGLTVHVASVEHLVALKKIAGRPQDLADIERLQSGQPGIEK